MKILKIENLEVIEAVNIIYQLDVGYKGSMIAPFKFKDLSRAIKEEEQKTRDQRRKNEKVNS